MGALENTPEGAKSPTPGSVAGIIRTSLDISALPEVPRENPASVLSLAEIDEKMALKGFPELRQHWIGARKIDPPSLDQKELARAEDRHMAPLFGKTIAVGCSIACAATFANYAFHTEISSMFESLGRVANAALFTAGVANFMFVAAYFSTMLQRYLIYPMTPLIERELALMLRRQDFRAWHDGQPQSCATVEKLRSLGINAHWDNPEYRARYSYSGKNWQQLEPESKLQFVGRVLREFLGRKDLQRRKYYEGIYAKDLAKGKKSVTDFVDQFTGDLARLRAGTLTEERGYELLLELKRSAVRAGSEGERYLAGAIEAYKGIGEKVAAGEFEARIWSRDPWVDLTHQEEFYSSASLRGVKWLGRGSKGRLGTFGYLNSKGISALDFSIERGRVVRARIAAAIAHDRSGAEHAILYVDGVEGSSAGNPRVIKQGIEDFARVAGFRAVIYNQYVHNQMPAKFVRYVASTSAEVISTKLRYVDCSRRQYLDSFGAPLEPFEYAYPQGRIIGRYVPIRVEQPNWDFRKPTMLERTRAFFTRNLLWAIVGESTLSAAILIGCSEPRYLAGLAVISILGVAIQLRYQNKGMRATASNLKKN